MKSCASSSSTVRIRTFVFLSFFAFLLQTETAFADKDKPLFHFCSKTTGNFTRGSTYESNLQNLLILLQKKTPPTGFARHSSGKGKEQNTAHGLALCRGDVGKSRCRTCIADASSEIRRRCPHNKGAIIWHDHCLLKYSDVEFFGQIDNANKFYMWNINDVAHDKPTKYEFTLKTKSFLRNLSKKAVKNHSNSDDNNQDNSKKYSDGTATVKLGNNKKGKALYGLTQCTNDLSRDDCSKCLNGIINELQMYSYGKVGGRVISGSCNFRYEIYPFVSRK